jgi:hypothetical protein
MTYCFAQAIQKHMGTSKLELELAEPGATNTRRTPPNYTFSRTPHSLMTSYYDYMIGGHNSLPLRVIPASAGGGYFMTYHGRRAPTVNRRVFFGHLDAAGNLINNNEITGVNKNEGYPTLAVDPVSGKPMYAWQCNADGDPELEVEFTSDAFITGISAIFNELQIIADGPTAITPPMGDTTFDNEFIWPTAQIGPSPVAGMRRVYIAMRNSVSHTYGPSENVYIAYADFNADMIEGGVPLAWNHTTIPEMNQWNHDVDWRRPFHAITTDNYGNLYYAGYHLAKTPSGNRIDEPDMDIFICPNYGEGEWSRISDYSNIPSWNPAGTPDGTDYLFGSGDVPHPDDQLVWAMVNSSHLNAVTDNRGRIIVPGLWAQSIVTGDHWPSYHVVKCMIYDPTENSFSIKEIFPQKDPLDNHNQAYTPWDVEAPWGEPEYHQADDGNIYLNPETIYPFPHWDNSLHSDAMLSHYNNVKVSEVNDQGMMVAVWQDSQRAKWANENSDPNYAAFAQVPEIYISVSANQGDNWSEPIILNSVEVAEFANIKPMWVYPADRVLYVGQDGNQKIGKIGLMFYNDYTWGSHSIAPAAHPTNDGGTVMFTELEIVFPPSIMDGMGSLQGTVTDNGTPLAGATVSVAGTALPYTTGADGTYSFTYIAEGAQQVTATKHGYTSVTHTVNIVEDQTTTQNFALALLPQVTVTGRIVGSDAPSVGIAGATISLSAYETYEATTNATGNFTIDNVVISQSCSYAATAPGYAITTGQLVVGTTDVNMGDIIVNEIALPPHSLVALESDDNSIVTLNWQAPVLGRIHNTNIGDLGTHSGIGSYHDHSIIKPDIMERSFIGYHVYRMLAVDQGNQAYWETLTNTAISATEYTDNTYAGLPSGVYKYAVKAVYTNNALSPAAFSNELHKDMMGTLNGSVSDFGTGLPIEDATITAGDYSGTTNANGEYSFAVYAGNYSVTAAKAGYQAATENGVVITETQTTTLDFTLSEITLPPSIVQAEEAGSNVNITWMAPGTAGGEWITWCDTEAMGNSIGTNAATEFDVAHMFDAADLAAHQGGIIAQIKFVPAHEACVYTVKVWTGGTAIAPGTLVYSAVHENFTINEWNLHVLTTPVAIPADRLWIGFHVNTQGGYPAGCDDGPVVEGKGNMMNFGGWTTLTQIAPTLTYNWSIQGFAANGTALKNVTPKPIVEAPKSTPTGTLAVNRFEPNRNRALEGYKVWRLLQGQESNEAAWTTLTENPISATAYQDTGWGSVADGLYKWAVKAVYTGDAMSNATFSNNLEKITIIGNLSGVVRNVQSQPIAGATVSVNDHILVTNENGEYDIELDEGIYTVSVSAHAYYPTTIEDVEIVRLQTTTLDISLAPLPLVRVSGRILGSDTGSAIANATFSLSGYHDYNATTNSFGQFSINDVYGANTYTYSIVAAGYDLFTGEVNVGSNNVLMGNIIINESCYPPQNVVAMPSPDEQFVSISWDALSARERGARDKLSKDSRALTGYRVYRFPISALTQPQTWTEVSSGTVQGLSFNDMAWTMLAEGDYAWAVRAIYTGGLISEPTISNTLYRGFLEPAAPQYLELAVQGNLITLSWESVSTDIHGNPLEADYYLIYMLDSPHEEPSPYHLIDITEQSICAFEMAGTLPQMLFFRIVAVKDEAGYSKALPQLQQSRYKYQIRRKE